jgi:hypothetical protein
MEHLSVGKKKFKTTVAKMVYAEVADTYFFTKKQKVLLSYMRECFETKFLEMQTP